MRLGLLALLIVGALGACSKEPPPSKAEQCEALLDTITKHEANKTESDDPNALLRSAAAVEKAGAAVAGVALIDEDLIEMRHRYAKMARDLAFTARDAAHAFAKDDEEAKTRARDRLSTSRAVERNVRKELERLCP